MLAGLRRSYLNSGPQNNQDAADEPWLEWGLAADLGVRRTFGEVGVNHNPRPYEPGYLLGGMLIAVLVSLLAAAILSGEVAGSFKRGSPSFFTGLYLQAWGLMFLASYYFCHKTFFLRGLMWVCEHLSNPRGRGMAFFYFCLAFSLGTVALIRGLGLCL